MIRRSIGARLGLIFAVLILMMTAIGAKGFVSLYGTAESIKARVAVSYNSATEVAELREAARQAHHLLANAGSSATSVDQGRLRDDVEQFKSHAASISSRRSVAGLDDAVHLFERMIASGQRYVDATTQQKWREQGEASVTFEANSDELDRHLDRMKTTEQRATDQAIASIAQDVTKNSEYFAGGILVCVAMAMALSFALQRSLVLPLRALIAATKRIAQEGDLTQEVDLDAQGEIGELALAFQELVKKLREIPANLHASVQLLHQAVSNLGRATTEHGETLTKQAVALQETQVTAQEIKQTSVLAAQKADAVLQVVERADEIGRTGEAALDQSLSGLNDIRASVEEIAQKIALLSERTTQIGGITETVKDLADQSNMLALNAAIEAVRSGEHGKGFAVVAREIRSLADQSVTSTRRVSEILGEISRAIDGAVSITETGERRMEAGIRQIKTSGENLRELSTIVKGNASAVRQIAAAVSQQNAGIAQIFAAVTDMSKMMDDTLTRLTAATHAATVLQDATEKVSLVVERFRV
jgi:methyl-accepting chemotaxis protein